MKRLDLIRMQILGLQFKKINLFCIIAITLIVCFLFKDLILGWWRIDDPVILKTAIKYNPLEYFFIPSIWQKQTTHFFTPWLTASYDLDFFLFGPKPTFFYCHHLITIWLIAIILFFFLKKWIRAFWALTGSVLFLVSLPVLICSQLLMTRHYLEGLLFIICSVYIYSYSLSRNSVYWSCLSAVFYLLAMSCKEIYVPFVLVFFFWPEKDIKYRVKFFIPIFISSFIYLPWRLFMLPKMFEAYGKFNNELPFFDILQKTVLSVIGDGILNYLGFTAAVVLTFLVIYTFRKKYYFILSIIFTLIIPLWPVLSSIHSSPRLLLLPWIIFSIAIVFFLDYITNFTNKKQFLCILTVLFLIFIPSINHSHQRYKQSIHNLKRYDIVGEFIWSNEKKDCIAYLPVMSHFPQYFIGLYWLKKKFKDSNKNFKYFIDEIQLKNHENKLNDIWLYIPKKMKLIQDVNLVKNIISEWETKIKYKGATQKSCRSKPLKVLFLFRFQMPF